MMIDLTNATVASYFENKGGPWKCKQTGFSIHGGILQFYPELRRQCVVRSDLPGSATLQ